MKNVLEIINKGKSIILFDGICNFCNSSINFVMDRDVHNKFMFASLQSDEGDFLIKKYGVDVINNDSIILIEENNYYLRSTAALRIAKKLRGAWKFFYIFIIVPPPIRDFLYNVIAKNRYKWFGKRETCRIPTPSERLKFL